MGASDEEECKHGMIGPCSMCLAPKRKKEKEDMWGEVVRVSSGGAVAAQYPGFCRALGDRIEVGEMIVRDGEGWSHDSCADG